MDLVIISNTEKIMVTFNDQYPSPVTIPVGVWYKSKIVNFEIQVKDGNEYINVLMYGTSQWQLDNEGNNLGLPVTSVNGVDVTSMTNRQLLTELYNNL